MKIGKWMKIIGDVDTKLDLKKILKRTSYALIPFAGMVMTERFIRGRLYVKFHYPHIPSMSYFLKNNCTCLQGSESYLQSDFQAITSKKETDKKIPARVYFNSLKAGNIFLSKNYSIIFAINNDKEDNSSIRNNAITVHNEFSIYIIGPNFEKDLEMIRGYYEKYLEYNCSNSIRVQSIKSGRLDLKFKPLNGIFSDQKEEILQEVDRILYKFNISRKFMIASTSAIVLHGKPGTGKSLITRSIIKYIQEKNRFKDGVEIAYLTKNDLSKNKLISKISDKLADDDCDSLNIIIIDDCDMMLKPRKEESLDNEKDMKKNLTGDLMNILDNGIPNMTNPLLVIMTTNYLDKIDHAILRPGRTDACIEVKDICIQTAEKMCSYYKIDFIQVRTKFPQIIQENNKVNPAALQQAIINILSNV